MVRIAAIAGTAMLAAMAAPARAQTAPSAALPWTVASDTRVARQDVRFKSHDTTLSGTLYHPAGGKALGTVIALHGAGAPLRSEPLYRHLIEMMPRLGMAVFVYDRRGSGASPQGNTDPGDFDVLAGDAVAAFAALARNPVVDARRIGFWGLSQGGWLTLLAQAREPRTAFAVAASAPMAAADVQMNFAVANILRIRGHPQATIDAAIGARTTVDDYVRGKRSRADAEAAEAAARRQPWWKDIWLNGNIDDPAWRAQINTDPLRAIAGSRVPTLILFGQADPWVPVSESLKSLERRKAKFANVTTRVIDGADHAMMIGVDPKLQIEPAYAASVAPDAPAYFAQLAAWLEAKGMTGDID